MWWHDDRKDHENHGSVRFGFFVCVQTIATPHASVSDLGSKRIGSHGTLRLLGVPRLYEIVARLVALIELGVPKAMGKLRSMFSTQQTDERFHVSQFILI